MNLNASNQTPAVNVPMFNVVIFEICTFGHVKIDIILVVKFSVWAKQLNFVVNKVKTLEEGHKIQKNLPPVFAKQLFLLNSVKTSGRFF